MSGKEVIDFRSDTITQPTQEMRESMKEAEVGDDVMREDPTILKLEEKAANLLGKEAAMLVTSGTQGNLSSILTQTNSGEEIILEQRSHIYTHEVGGFASLGGLSVRPIFGENGFMDPIDVEQNIKDEDIHHASQSLICIENTHNSWGGVPLGTDYINTIGDIAEDNDLKLHIDGARLFNASVALDEKPKNLVEPADSIQICLSKGLSAPIGSLVIGSEEFIQKARKTRKMLGGGMRQAGVIAAPGIVALEDMIDRLEKDHKKLSKLTHGLSDLGMKINPDEYKTNIAYFDTSTIGLTGDKFKSYLENKGILVFDTGDYEVRFVTHKDVSEEEIKIAIDRIENLLEEISGS